ERFARDCIDRNGIDSGLAQRLHDFIERSIAFERARSAHDKRPPPETSRQSPDHWPAAPAEYDSRRRREVVSELGGRRHGRFHLVIGVNEGESGYTECAQPRSGDIV